MPHTVGQRLRQAREERYITLEKASDETRIRSIFIKALEADDFSVMPSAAQGRGFLRNYAAYLDLNIDEVIAELQKNAPAPEAVSGPLPQVSLVQTDIPALTEVEAERKTPHFWTSWFAWLQKSKPTPQEEVTESGSEGTPQPLLEVEVAAPIPRGRREKKKAEEISQAAVIEPGAQTQVVQASVEDEAAPGAAVQAQVTNEAAPNFLTRIIAFFRIRITGSETTTESTTAKAAEPAGETGTKPAEPVQPAEWIFAEIGKQLRERRELIGLTVDEVERHTRMRAALVKALEEGAFNKLPSSVQTRGMLANYAAFLDLDPDAILLRFADAIQARHREKYSETPREMIQTEVATSMPLLRSFIAGDLIFGIVMISIILTLAVWGIGRVLNSREQEAAQATAPSIVEVLAGSPQPTPSMDSTSLPANNASLATNAFGLTTSEAPTMGANINVIINIFAVERAFIRIVVDGQVAFEGRIAPRESQAYEAENQIEVLTGNAAALRITYNGRDLGLMGDIGEVVDRVYTIAGVVTPTSTVPPTATETPIVTMTPTPTVTRTPTVENSSTPSSN